MPRLMIAMVAVLLLGGFATNIAPPVETVQTVEAKKDKKDKKKDRRDKQQKREDRREKRMDRREVMAVSYINPDTNIPASFNPDVNPNSDCDAPDQRDTQDVSPPPPSNENNVHNDACLFKKGQPVDTAVSFELSAGSVGEFSACPDPDGMGTKTAINSGNRCYLTGYQETGMAGDEEYHARIDSSIPGESIVTFCADADNNGCDDEKIRDRIEIVWET